MPIFHDKEFGKVTVRRSARSSQVRLRVAPDGTLRASLPLYAPTFLVKRLLKTSRDEVRDLLSKSRPSVVYEHGMRIGKSHSLIVTPTDGPLIVKRRKQHIVVSLPKNESLESDLVQQDIRSVVVAALRIEAKSYLPKRLAFLANAAGLHYNTVRFSHASGRWGSCSSEGTISLNIALMKLPFALIDYVLIHELSHTKHMNHSPAFWDLVSIHDPHYKTHRAALKAELPSV